MSTRRTAYVQLAGLMISAALLAWAAPSGAQEPTPGPALWRVSDADTTLYLFGLPHMMDADTAWRTAAFDNALEEADAVMLEADRTSPEAQASLQQTVAQIGVYRDGRTLSALLDEETRAQAERVASALGVPMQGLDPLKPWLAANQLQSLMVQRAGLMNPQTPAAVITAEAAAEGMPVTYFEEPTTLLVAVGDLPEDSQLRLFKQALDIIETDPGQPQRILSMWAEGDVESLDEAFHGEGEWADETVRSAMLLERNALWQARIDEIMESETGVYFAAVGVGHLVGEDSIVSGLDRGGYAITRE